jgi:hypothetical protein
MPTSELSNGLVHAGTDLDLDHDRIDLFYTTQFQHHKATVPTYVFVAWQNKKITLSVGI